MQRLDPHPILNRHQRAAADPPITLWEIIRVTEEGSDDHGRLFFCCDVAYDLQQVVLVDLEFAELFGAHYKEIPEHVSVAKVEALESKSSVDAETMAIHHQRVFAPYLPIFREPGIENVGLLYDFHPGIYEVLPGSHSPEHQVIIYGCSQRGVIAFYKKELFDTHPQDPSPPKKGLLKVLWEAIRKRRPSREHSLDFLAPRDRTEGSLYIQEDGKPKVYSSLMAARAELLPRLEQASIR
jgi:hypothetical protein